MDTIKYLVRRHAQLLDVRQPLDKAWRDLADHFLPTRYRNMDSGLESWRHTPMLNDKLVDATGILAMRTLAAGLQGGMTSPSRPWFQLNLDDPELSAYHGVRTWLDIVAKRMRDIFHRSNFYNAIHTLYGELGTFGTAFMMELADFDNGFRFIPFCAGEYCLDINACQRVDVVFRRFHMTSRQLLMQFGASALPEYVSKVHRGTGQEEQFSVVHAIFPRKERSLDRADSKNKAFASVYWLEAYGGGLSTSMGQGSGRGVHVLSESGFDEFPGYGVRWDVAGNDVYGRSPAMDVLPDCRMLQQMGISTLKAIHKAVDPPTAVAASLKGVGLDLTPGGVNYVEVAPGQAPQAATPIIQAQADIQAARLAMQDVQKQIQQGLYNDLFRMLLSSNRAQITAREIAAREEEKLVLIGPVVERLHDEMFIPLIDRTFKLMMRHNMLPAPPRELGTADIKVDFVSLLAQAQKMVATSAVDQMMSFVGRMVGVFPEVKDAVDVDSVVDEYAEYLGIAVGMIRPRDDRENVRKERNAAQAAVQQKSEQQQTLSVIPDLAKSAKDLASIPMGGDTTAIKALLGGME